MSLDKFSAAVHYVISKDDFGDVGKTKLNKILWFSDCAAWRKLGHTITGLKEYAKLQYGPVPPNIERVLLKLSLSGKISADQHYVGTYLRHAYKVRKPYGKKNILSNEELEIIDSVMSAVKPLSAFDVSELSHDELWEATPHGKMIPVQAAASQFITPDERIMDWARKSG